MFRYGATPLQLNTWYHVAGVYNATAGTLDVYLERAARQRRPRGDGHVITAELVGERERRANARPGGFQFNGRIDDTRIYSRPLTQTEIQTDMSDAVRAGLRRTRAPPTVAITSPAQQRAGQRHRQRHGNASDNVGVAGVQFLVDGVRRRRRGHHRPLRPRLGHAHGGQRRPHPDSPRARRSRQHHALRAGHGQRATPTSSRTRSSPPASTCPPTSSSCPTAACSSSSSRARSRSCPPPYTQPDPDAVPAAHERRHVRRAAGASSTSRSTRTSSPTTSTTSSTRCGIAEPRSPVALHRQRHATPARSPAARSCSTRTRSTPNAEHHGGALNFGNDGKLYFTTGEHFDAGDAQTADAARAGRSTASTRTAPSRPTTRSTTEPGPNVDSIWALGLRNPFRAYYDAPTGRLYVGDVGGNDYSTAEEEVNLGAARRQLRLAELRRAPAAAPCTPPLYSYAAQRPRRGDHRRVRLPRHASSRAATREATSSPTTRRTGSGG